LLSVHFVLRIDWVEAEQRAVRVDGKHVLFFARELSFDNCGGGGA
jgi:hypothetical protein